MDLFLKIVWLFSLLIIIVEFVAVSIWLINNLVSLNMKKKYEDILPKDKYQELLNVIKKK